MRIWLPGFTLLALASCDGYFGYDPPPPDPLGQAVTARPLGEIRFAGAEVFNGASPAARAARLELFDGVMDRFAEVRKLVRAGEGESVGKAAIETVLERGDLTEAERWFLDQMSATLTLESMVDGLWDDVTAAYCVDLLVRHESPNAALIATALERLDGFWSPARIARVAEAARHRAERWLAGSCGGCERSGGSLRTADEPQARAMQQVVRGVADLKRIAHGR